MILYGWNNYLLKSIRLQDLGIQRSQDQDMVIEYRQKYFHLFFIPVFPLGKFWAIKQGGKLYEPSESMRQSLQSVNVNTKNWIWSWTGILVAVGSFFIYSFSEKMDNYSYQKRREASASVLGAYFKEQKNTTPLASKLRSINYLIDSCINEEAYEKKKIDTSMGGLLKLYFNTLESQKDSLTGYNRKNTLVFSCIDHKKDKGSLPDEYIKKALDEGVWKGYSDSATVFQSIRQLNNYKFLLVLKEYNRMNPTVKKEGYSSGVSLVDGFIINIESKKIEHSFKVMGTNSESVSYFSFRRKGESKNVRSEEWYQLLEGDLNSNVVKKGTQYVFHEESPAAKK